ncbi:uncharacterized protein LOC120375888 isoform X2 [Mauremys reevesii]|uniref:uncharacterized protein LOC120375888 isoform X2 n=1 Tax=Mauremys reevesii TaxID=260615 RepID=UPI00193ED51D|nr:uncharacterized protein LOC120375888 isoform X2 [Mauremys reevesii]
MYLNFRNKKGWENLHLKSGLENWDMAQELELATTTDQVAEGMEKNLSKYFLHEPYKHRWSNSVTGEAVQPPLPKEQDESDVQPHLWMWVNPNLVCPITGYLNKGVPGKPVHLVAPAPKAAVTKLTSVKPRPPVAAALQTSSGQCVSVPLVTAAPKVATRKYSSVKAVALITTLQTSPVASVSIPPLAASDAVSLQASTFKNVPRKPVFPILLAAVAPKVSTPVKPVPPVAAASKASNRKHASGKTVPPVADTMQVCAHTPGKNMSLEAAALVDSYQKPVLIAYKQLCPKEEVLLCSSEAKEKQLSLSFWSPSGFTCAL